MVKSIAINSVKSRGYDFVIEIASSGIQNFNSLSLFINNETIHTGDNLNVIRVDLMEHVTALRANGKVSFTINYSDYQILNNDNTYSFVIKSKSVSSSNGSYAVEDIVSNVINTQREIALTVPVIKSDNILPLDNAIRVELENNGYDTHATLITFNILNNDHRSDTNHNTNITFDLTTHTGHVYTLNLPQNASNYEINAQTIQYIDQTNSKFSGISNTVIASSINSSNPVNPISETIGDDSKLTILLGFVEDWNVGYDDYDQIRVYIYNGNNILQQFDLNTADLTANNLQHQFTLDLIAGGQYDLEYATQNLGNGNTRGNISAKTTIANQTFTGFGTLSTITNVTFNNVNQENMLLSWTGYNVTGLNSTTYTLVLSNVGDNNDTKPFTITAHNDINNTTYSISFDSNDITAGIEYNCSIQANFTTKHTSTGTDQNKTYNNSVTSSNNMPYKLVDDPLIINKLTTDGSNVLLNFIGSDGLNGIFPLNYNIELMYKNGDNFINIVDTDNAESPDNKLNQFIDATQIYGISHELNYIPTMLDHEYNSNNNTSITETIRFDNFNIDTSLGNEYSVKFTTSYKEFNNTEINGGVIVSQIFDNLTNSSVKTYNDSPNYTGDITITDVNDSTVTFLWPTAPAIQGLTFNKYNVVLYDLNGEKAQSDVTDSNTLTHTFNNLVNGTEYFVRVNVVYTTNKNGKDTPANVNTNTISSNVLGGQGTPYKSNLLLSNLFNVDTTSITTIFNDGINNNNITIGWAYVNNLLSNASTVGLKLKRVDLSLVPEDGVSASFTSVINTDIITTTSHTFNNVPYNNVGYKPKITIVFQPVEDDIADVANRVILGKEVVGALRIPFDNVVTDDNNFKVTSLVIGDFVNDISGTNDITVNWNIFDNAIATAKGLTFKEYIVDLVDLNGNNDLKKTITITTRETITHTFNTVAYNINGYKAIITSVFEPIETSNTTISGSSLDSTNTLIVYDKVITGSGYNVTDVNFTNTVDNNTNVNISVSWTNVVDLQDTMDLIGLDFVKFVVKLTDAVTGLDVDGTSADITVITSATHTFNNVAYNNNGYHCIIKTIFKPKDTSYSNEEIVTDLTSTTDKLIPASDDISVNPNFNVNNITFNSFNNLENGKNSIEVKWDGQIINSNATSKGLDFEHYLIELYDATTQNIVTTYIDTTITSDSHTFTDVIYNNNGYKCKITCVFSKLADANDTISGAIVYCTRTFIPYDQDVGTDYTVSDLDFTLLNNKSISIGWTNYTDLVNSLSAVGLDFKHFIVDLIQQGGNTVNDKTTNITTNTTNTHTFTDVAYSNTHGYKCRVTAVFNPKDTVDSNIDIQSNAITSTRIAKPFNNNISANNDFKVSTVTIDSFNNVNTKNDVIVTWNDVVTANNAALNGLQFKYYTIELVDVANNVSLKKTSNNNTIGTTTHTFNEVDYNNNGYKAKVIAVYQPFDDQSITDVVIVSGDTIESGNTLIPYQKVVGAEFLVADIILKDLSNDEVILEWTPYTNLINELSAVGLDFKHYSFGFTNVATNVDGFLSTTIINSATSTNTFSGLDFVNSYKLKFNSIFKPKDPNFSNTNISNDTLESTRTIRGYDNDVVDDSNFNLTSITFGNFTNEADNKHNLVVDWVGDAHTTNVNNKGLQFKHYQVELVNLTDNSVVTTSTITDVNTKTTTFNDIIYNNNGYKCRVTNVYKPFDNNSSNVVVLGSVITSTRTIIPYDKDIENNYVVSNIIFTQLNDQSISVGWTKFSNLATTIANIGLEFKHYIVELIDENGNNDLKKTTTINNINTVSHEFTGVSYNNNGYKCKVTSVFRPKDSVDTGVEISSDTISSTRIVKPFDNDVTDDANFKVTNVDFAPLDNNITVTWNTSINNTTLENKGLNFSSYLLEIINLSDSSVIVQTISTDITFSTFHFSNVTLPTSYKVSVTTRFTPLDNISQQNGVSIVGANVDSTRTFIQYDTDVSNEYQISNIVFTELNDTSVTVGWNNYPNLQTEITNVGLAFKYYNVKLIHPTTKETVEENNVTNINASTTTFQNVAYSTDGYQCRIISYFNPIDTNHSSEILVNNPVDSTRTIIIYENNISNNLNYQVSDIEFNSFTNNNNNEVVINWTHNISNVNANLIGLKFKHYKVDLVDQNGIIATKTTNLTTIATTTHTFTNIGYNSNGYKCEITVVFEPLDSVSQTANVTVLSQKVSNIGTFIPYVKDVTGLANNNIVSSTITNIPAYNTLTDRNTVTVSWEKPAGYVTNNNNLGIYLDQYMVELIPINTNINKILPQLIDNVNTITTTFNNILFDSQGYKVSVIPMYKSLSNILPVELAGDTVESGVEFTTINTALITNSELYLTLSKTLGNNDSSVTINWVPQDNNVGDYQFEKYNVVVTDKTDSAVLSNTDITTNTDTDETIANITNGKTYEYKVIVHYKRIINGVTSNDYDLSYESKIDDFIVTDIVSAVTISANGSGKVKLDFVIQPNGNTVNKLVYNIINFSNDNLVTINENVTFNTNGTVTHSKEFDGITYDNETNVKYVVKLNNDTTTFETLTNF